MAEPTPTLGLEKPDESDFYSVPLVNRNADRQDAEVAAVRQQLSPSADKATPIDADYLVVDDSADGHKKKRWTFANFLTWLRNLFYTKAEVDSLNENIEKRTDPLAQTVGETILSSVLEYPTHTLGYMGTKAPDAPPGYGGSWAKIFSIGGSKNYGLTVYFMANDSITVFTRSIVNGAWTESSWTEVVSNPAWFVLPLFTGFLSVADHACMYSKEGCTTFVKGILRVTDINKVGSEFAQLPNGYQLKDGLSSKFLGLREGTNGTVQIATYRDGNLQFSLPSWEMSVGDEIRIDGSFKQ